MRIGIKLFLLGILVSSICSVLRAAEMARADTLLSLEDESGMQMRRDASLFSMGRSVGLMENDTISVPMRTDTVSLRTDTVPVRTDRLMEVRPLAAMPLLILAATAAPQADWHIRNIRNRYFPHLRMHWDDYVQFAPLALSLSLPAGGITPRGGQCISLYGTFVRCRNSIARSTRHQVYGGQAAPAGQFAQFVSERTYGNRFPRRRIVGPCLR